MFKIPYCCVIFFKKKKVLVAVIQKVFALPARPAQAVYWKLIARQIKMDLPAVFSV